MNEIYAELHSAIAENALNQSLNEYFTKRRIERTKVAAEKSRESFEEEFVMMHNATTSTYTFNNIFENIAEVKGKVKSISDVSYGNVIAFLKDTFQDIGKYSVEYVKIRSAGKNVKEAYETAVDKFTVLVQKLNDGIKDNDYTGLSEYIQKFRFK